MLVLCTVSCCTSFPSRLSPAGTRNTLPHTSTACSHLTYPHCVSSHHSIDERVSLRSVLAVSSNFPSLKSLAEKLEPTNKPQSRSGSTAGFPIPPPSPPYLPILLASTLEGGHTIPILPSQLRNSSPIIDFSLLVVIHSSSVSLWLLSHRPLQQCLIDQPGSLQPTPLHPRPLFVSVSGPDSTVKRH
jgi:hypothetical protein